MRKTAPTPGQERSRLYILLGATGVAAVAVAIALVFVLTKSEGRNDAETLAAIRAAGCTAQSSPADSAGRHMQTENQKVTYTTYPPTSGTHNPTTAQWGNYSTPADPRHLVHNMEHGGIVVWWGTKVTAETRDRITGWYERDQNGVFVTPIDEDIPNVTYPPHKPLGSRVALTAWIAPSNDPGSGRNILVICPGFNEEVFDLFRKEFRGRGPERVPVDSNKPGGF